MLLAPFAPHLSEELWEMLGHQGSVFNEPWPNANEEVLKNRDKVIVIQVNGKLRGEIKVGVQATKEEIEALAVQKVQSYIPEGQKIVKTIYVPNKLVSIVTK